MASSPYSLEHRFEFITECYKSGFFIPCWCDEHNIAHGTFYGWIRQVTNHGYELLDSLNFHPSAKKQEVIKIPVIDDVCTDFCLNVIPYFQDIN